MKTVLISGATSFTGAHIAKAFLKKGWTIKAFLTRPLDAYAESAIQERIGFVSGVEWVPSAPFGSDNFLRALAEHQDFVLVNHGADIKGYRRPDFDIEKSKQSSLFNLPQVLKVLLGQGCARMIHSGTIFERDGHQNAVSPYGESKSQVWESLAEQAGQVGLPLSKIVIPNPIGPFENQDRLMPLFWKKWKAGETPVLSTPDVVWDNIPAPWLAAFYVAEAEQASDQVSIRRPSAYKISVKELLDRVLAQSKQAHQYKIEINVAANQVVGRVNSEPCVELSQPDQEQQFWRDYHHWLESL